MKTISHYTLIERIGSGGMGEVFLAEDEALGRKVALKLLPQQFTQDALRLQRFQKEARVVSALNHPNILTIFEIGSADGEQFIVTEYIEGETLRQRNARGSMPLLELIDLAIGVGTALNEAHKAGVVHRDIKPENIMIRRDGLVKVLDFGLAKRTGEASAAESATAIRETAPGTVLGTVSYMSPEQARGLEVDARSDLFSLGAVLYEALTGHIPFEGTTSTDILAAILHREPPPITRYTCEVPREVQWIVEKALHKDREERYQTAKEMVADLKRVRRQLDAAHHDSASISGGAAVDSQPRSSGPSPTPEVKSISSAEYIISGIRTHRKSVAGVVLILLIAIAGIFYVTNSTAKPIDSVAVLPFANASGDPNIDYLADGLTENLINSLSEISGLRVVPRSSVFRYKDSTLAIEDIAKELGARAILTGRLRKQGDVVTIQAELVDIAARSQLWGERLETSMRDIVGAERKLAQQSAAKLRPNLSGTEQQRVEKPYTKDAEAYDLYLKARYYWNKRTPADIRTAIDFLRRALDRDPNFALAWAALADAYIVLPNYDESIESGDAYPKAREAAQRALAIDPAMAEAHASLAGVLFEYDWNAAEADKEFRKAIELKPNYAPARYWYADYLLATGRPEEGLEQAKKAHEADPLSVVAAATVALLTYAVKGPDAALAEVPKVEELEPNSWRSHLIRALAYRSKGMNEDAAREYDAMAAGGDARARVAALALRGKKNEALALVRESAKGAEANGSKAFNVGAMYAFLDDHDESMRWLERAYALRSAQLPYSAREEAFDSLRDDPRFVALLGRVGVPVVRR